MRTEPTRLACVVAAAGLVVAAACGDSPPSPLPPPAAQAESAWVEIAGELFELELALDASARYRGLSGRRTIPRNGGMLFAFPDSRPLSFVMRHCPVAIDLAFLDESGRILRIHEMQPEPPRRQGESAVAYEQRLPAYPSGAPARFALETAGGRLAQVGAAPGQQAIFDTVSIAERAR